MNASIFLSLIALGEGGQIKMPLTEKSYAGFLADKFNINGVFTIDKA